MYNSKMTPTTLKKAPNMPNFQPKANGEATLSQIMRDEKMKNPLAYDIKNPMEQATFAYSGQ